MTTATTANRSSEPRRLWFVLLAGPVSFSVLFLAVYLLNELSCNLGYLLASVGGLTVSSVISLLLVAITLAVTLYAGYLADGIRREMGRETEPWEENGESNNTYFTGLAGVGLSVLFTFLTLAIGAAVLLLRPC